MKKFLEEDNIIFNKDDLISVIDEVPCTVVLSADDYATVIEKLHTYFKEAIKTYMYPKISELVEEWINIDRRIKGSNRDTKAEEQFQDAKDGYKRGES